MIIKGMESWALGVMLTLLVCAPSADAHVASNGFVQIDLRGGQLSGVMELSVRDAELAVGLDADHDGDLTWGEVKRAQPAFALYLRTHLQLDSGSPCALTFAPVQIIDRIDGPYLWQPFTGSCVVSRVLRIRYSLLGEEDPTHRGLLTLRAAGAVQTAVLGGSNTAQTIQLDRPDAARALAQYFAAGVGHIWAGIDHLLFLLSLLLPAVLVRRDGHWQAVTRGAPALLSIIKVVTAFTLAHSITLSLAAFDIIRLPSRLTESVIAASIVVAALNNVFPVITQTRWRLAFAFGLLHGFGFASVLSEMGLPQGARLLSLLGFNLGVEAGQLAVVAAVMPLAFWLRRSAFYEHGILRWGSVGIAGLATVWLVQRASG